MRKNPNQAGPSDTAAAIPERRKRRSAEELTAAILAAARTEFDLHGPSRATTAAIASRAGVTEAQLFRYFPNKSALFREAVFGALQAHFAAFLAANQPFPPDDRDATMRYVAELTRFLRANRKSLLALHSAQAFGGEPVTGGPIAALSAYFEAGAALRSRRAGTPEGLSQRLAVRVSFAAVLGSVMFEDWLFPADLGPAEAIEAALAGFVLDGIGRS